MTIVTGTYVVVGGGIAGVSCTETLAFLQPNDTIILLSESSLIKTVTNIYAITRTITHFDIDEQSINTLKEKYDNLTVIHDVLEHIDTENSYLLTKSHLTINYKYLCLCLGAEPKLIPQADNFPDYIIGIRDTDSVENFIKKLKNSKKIIIIGNGGIASEIVYKIQKTQVDWIIKNKHISATFVDPGAAQFFLDSLSPEGGTVTTSNQISISKRMRYTEEEYNQKFGAALGPDWYQHLTITGASTNNLNIHYESEIASVTQRTNNQLDVTLDNGKKIVCDLIVSATGVRPRTNFTSTTSLIMSNDNSGILVDEFMRTNVNNIYVAGDLCCANWSLAKHWFQMKLWTQARHMGCYAAKCMSGHRNNEEILQDFCFEMFTHSTKLFGFNVILLGLFNGQKLDDKYEILIRTTKNNEYVKFIIENHRLQGAVLIGDTDLEETCENLILNQIDLEPYGDDILNPNIDIEDYFD